MKETVEVVKCDLCGETIDTNIFPKDEYHYRYRLLKLRNDCIVTVEKDICPVCASVINKIYNGKHSEDINKYIHANTRSLTKNVLDELVHGNGPYNDNTTITTTIGHLKSIIFKVFLHE